MLKRNRDGKNQMNIKESNHATEKQASNSTEVPSSSARLGALCCMIGATSWGFSGTCGEALFSSYPIDAAWVTALRMLGAGTILLLAAAAKGKLPVRALVQDKKAMAQMVLFSFLGLVLSQYAYLNAINGPIRERRRCCRIYRLSSWRSLYARQNVHCPRNGRFSVSVWHSLESG